MMALQFVVVLLTYPERSEWMTGRGRFIPPKFKDGENRPKFSKSGVSFESSTARLPEVRGAVLEQFWVRGRKDAFFNTSQFYVDGRGLCGCGSCGQDYPGGTSCSVGLWRYGGAK
jgi:hypothetical protein